MRRILLLGASTCSGAGLFTKQLRCSDGICTDVLSGLITLTNAEAFEYASFNVKDVQNSATIGSDDNSAPNEGTSDIPVMLKIEKSRLLIAYGLAWEKDVVGGIMEDVYDYTWATAGGSHAFDGSDFDRDRCAEEAATRSDQNLISKATYLAAAPDDGTKSNLEQLLNGGRVCGCRDTGWATGSYTDVQRSDLNCNAWPAVFRPGSTTWASRHCPRLLGPMYSVYSIKDWKWEYHVKVTMNWTSANLTHSRSYYLNWTNPEVRDEELDFTFKILFSLPQFGQQPPDLHATHYLLIPKVEGPVIPQGRGEEDFLYTKMTREERMLDSLSESSLLIPKDRVDLTGRGCESVGVSLYTWAKEENGRKGRNKWVAQQAFCESKPGSCIHLQPNDLLEVDQQLQKDGKKPQWILKEQLLDGWSQSSPYLLSDRGVLAPDRSLNKTQQDITNGTTTEVTSTAAPLIMAAPLPPMMPQTLAAGILAWPTDQSHSTQLEVSLNSSDIAWMQNSGLGDIEDILIHAAGSTVSVLVVVRNKEVEESKFTVSIPTCALQSENAHVNDADVELRKLEGSPPIINAAPVSKSIRGERTSGIIVPLDRHTGMTEASYTCQILLLNSRGSLLRNETAHVTFAALEPAVVNLEQPLQSDTPVQNFRINPSDLRAQAYTPESNLRAGWSTFDPSTSGWFGECNCDLWNIWCFATHIVDCTKAVRAIVIFGAGLVGASILFVAFLPCLVRTCASCISFTSRQVSRTRRELQLRKNSDASTHFDITRREITTVLSSDVASTPPTRTPLRSSHTPRNGNRQAMTRSVRSRCSRRAIDYMSPSVLSADRRQSRRYSSTREVSRSGMIEPVQSEYISRNTSRRCSPVIPERRSKDLCSRPTTASNRRTPPPPGRRRSADEQYRKELLRTLREKRRAKNSSFADDYQSPSSLTPSSTDGSHPPPRRHA